MRKMIALPLSSEEAKRIEKYLNSRPEVTLSRLMKALLMREIAKHEIKEGKELYPK